MKFKIKKILVLFKSKLIQVKKILFELNGKNNEQIYIKGPDSVHILIVDTNLNKFVLVKQPRLPLFIEHKKEFTIETCAGTVDKDKSIDQIAKEEVIEETGYSPDKFIKIGEAFSATKSSEKKHLYLCFSNKKISKGGGVDDENIDLVYMDLDIDPLKLDTDIVTLYLITWYQKNYLKRK